jgi:hypothetical protein
MRAKAAGMGEIPVVRRRTANCSDESFSDFAAFSGEKAADPPGPSKLADLLYKSNLCPPRSRLLLVGGQFWFVRKTDFVLFHQGIYARIGI